MKPYFSESAPNMISALREAVGADGRDQVRLVCSDSPEVLCPVVRDHLPRVLCVAKDPLHVALKVESAANERVTPLSRLLRKCLRKFVIGGDDGKSYFRGNRRMVDIPSLGAAIGAMTPGRKRAVLKRIEGDAYPDKPYAGASHFLEDVAAACKEHPAEMNRKTNRGSTALPMATAAILTGGEGASAAGRRPGSWGGGWLPARPPVRRAAFVVGSGRCAPVWHLRRRRSRSSTSSTCRGLPPGTPRSTSLTAPRATRPRTIS